MWHGIQNSEWFCGMWCVRDCEGKTRMTSLVRVVDVRGNAVLRCGAAAGGEARGVTRGRGGKGPGLAVRWYGGLTMDVMGAT